MSAGTLSVTPLTEAVGARIDGVDLSGPFAPDAIDYDYSPDEPRRMHRTTVGGERPAAAFGG